MGGFGFQPEHARTLEGFGIAFVSLRTLKSLTPAYAVSLSNSASLHQPDRAPVSIMTPFLKGTYFGHKPFGFQSLWYVIHGWDVS